MYRDMTVRCYGERKNGQWALVCLEFSLVAQDTSFESALKSLDGQIACYLRDALVGQDRKHARYLLSRRAPAAYWVKYYVAKVANWLKKKPDVDHRSFRETLPLHPACP